MRIVLFCHSLTADWNHGSAHFWRGITAELIARRHEVDVYEPALTELDLDQALDGADLVVVHEFNDPELIRRIGQHHERAGGYRLLFRATHHRAMTASDERRRFDLAGFDGALASGEMIRQRYLDRGWAARAWTWHEAADTRVFAPRPGTSRVDDLVWVGNWGDGARGQELHQMLLGPAGQLKLSGVAHGAPYPWRARLAIRRSGLGYGGWLADHLVPAVLARHRFTLHLPQRSTGQSLPGIPGTWLFEALACGIPVISSAWDDAEGLFSPGRDYLVARDQREMVSAMRTLVKDRARAAALSEHGLATIVSRHTCAHRVDELFAIEASLRGGEGRPARTIGALG